MPKRSSKDENQLAKSVIDDIIAETESEPVVKPEKTERQIAAAMLGRIGGLKGGVERNKRLSDERKSEIARKAAQTRWAKKASK
jgi:hypothetical protein